MFAATVLSLLLGAQVPERPVLEKKTDLERLQGEWQVAEFAFKGKAQMTPRILKSRFCFKGETLTVKYSGEEGDKELTLKLYPAQQPRAIDLTPSDGSEKATLAIYELTGDTLRLGLEQRPGAPRPASFAAARENAAVVTLRRVQK